MRYRRLTPIGYAARRCDPVPMECEDLLHMRTDFSHGREVFERRSRSDCVHEQTAKRIANVRFTELLIFFYLRKIFQSVVILCILGCF